MVQQSNEFILPHKLTKIQEQVFIGGMLGDAALERAGAAKFPRMKIDRQAKDKEYLLWQFNIFSNLCSEDAFKEYSRYDERYKKSYHQVSFRTKAIPAFKEFHEKWYPDGLKIIPEDLELTPLVCAIWFADDGCILQTGKNALTMKISTDGFGKKGASLLAGKLQEKLGCEFLIYQRKKDRDLWMIKVATQPAIKFLEYIDPMFDICMERKAKVWEQFLPKINRQKIIDIEKSTCKTLRPLDRVIYGKVLADKETNCYIIKTAMKKDYNLSYSIPAISARLMQIKDEGFLELQYIADKSKYETPMRIKVFKITNTGEDFFRSEL